ncbi:MAG: four helix bundle protein [Chitinophagales bacterium]
MFDEKQYLTLNKIESYMIAFKLSNYVWKIVMKWDKFAQWTVGKQYVTAIDSISANIAEGFGRYHKKDKIKFYRYSTGSLQESLDWTRKAIVRKLITQEEKEYITTELQKLPKSLNHLIKFTNEKLKI